MSIGETARRLRREARRADERRVLVVRGDRESCLDGLYDALGAIAVERDAVTIVSTREGFRYERVGPASAARLLGRTRRVVAVDCFDGFAPNVIGRTVGAVEGGGLYVLLVPTAGPMDDRFRSSLAVPPFEPGDVGERFRERFEATLDHRGVAVYDADAERLERDGLTDPPTRTGTPTIHPPPNPRFSDAAYRACRTADQKRAVQTLERLATPGEAVVIEANRGRGKSSAAGIAAAELARDGKRVAVTAPAFSGASELFARARASLADADEGTDAGERTGVGEERDADGRADAGEEEDGSEETETPIERAELPLRTAAGGSITFHDAGTLDDEPGWVETADVVVVDEAAGLSVARLAATLEAQSVAFVTTIHGYEGAGRGFSVRFRERLGESAFSVTDCRLRRPIRYAPGDPVETWAFHLLSLDARPPVAGVLADADSGSVRYRRLSADQLANDERLLREVFGLLVVAHYRTEPDDLARLLDAPNLSVHALCHDGHPVSVALVAREGGLSAERREEMLTGGRVRGNLLPDVLTSQLRDPDAGEPVGYRVVRIATHSECRHEGFGSQLLEAIHDSLADSTDDGASEGVPDWRTPADEPPGPEQATGGDESAGTEHATTGDESADESAGTEQTTTGGKSAGETWTVGAASGTPRFPRADYFGTAFGATPGLVSFWRANGYRTVHLSTTRNDASGEHSAVMCRPATIEGATLVERHTKQFRDRIGGVLGDALRDADPETVRAVIGACGAEPRVPELSTYDWRVVVGASSGPGLYDVHPTPFRQLAVTALVDEGMTPPGGDAGADDTTDDTADADAGNDTPTDVDASDDTLTDAGNDTPTDADDDSPPRLTPREQRLLVGKVLQGRSWDAVADAEGYVSTGPCMRALGDAYRTIVARYGGLDAMNERERYE